MRRQLLGSNSGSCQHSQSVNADWPFRRTSAGKNWVRQSGHDSLQHDLMENQRKPAMKSFVKQTEFTLLPYIRSYSQFTTAVWSAKQRDPNASDSLAPVKAMLDYTGRKLGKAGSKATAAGGQPSSSVRRFLTEVFYRLSTFLMWVILYRFDGKNVPVACKIVPLHMEKMYRLMSKNVPAILSLSQRKEN
ncbi:hypothetical protein FYK55_27980 [Roseiconus nitratireducens]|uniref:Uncharacterized protein n=1 Tax=Roseiconus nitratireducens TaxID=2605748 RepID=A0A5M6CYM6_9BACT|nr:hypothetical protein [Roseiconus nitratireducens]KAA5537985.1 hypothetical protein FYK55_27980 [Roseiconus nitratireducens]